MGVYCHLAAAKPHPETDEVNCTVTEISEISEISEAMWSGISAPQFAKIEQDLLWTTSSDRRSSARRRMASTWYLANLQRLYRRCLYRHLYRHLYRRHLYRRRLWPWFPP
jgi:hypothetical protein